MRCAVCVAIDTFTFFYLFTFYCSLFVYTCFIRHIQERGLLGGLGLGLELGLGLGLGLEFHFDADEYPLLRSLLARRCFVHHKETGYIDFVLVGSLGCDRQDCFHEGGR